MSVESTRICTKCRQAKPPDCYVRQKNRRGGLDTYCRDCRRASLKRWLAINLDRQKQRRNRYYLENRERIRKYRTDNRDKINAVRLNRYYKNHRKNLAIRKRNYLKNGDRIRAKIKEKRNENPAQWKLRERMVKLKQTYGITLERYEAISELQKHRCAICGIPQVELKKKLCVDHNHSTGAIRGLLCHSCNTGLGYFKDNPSILTNATKYIHEHDSSNKTNSNQTGDRLSIGNSSDGGAIQR